MSLALALLLQAAAAPPADLPPGEGPRGTSNESRYDAVGYGIVLTTGSGMTVASDALPAGTFVEITALDSGRTIAARVAGGGAGAGALVGLSPAAAKALGVTAYAPLRVRRVDPSPQDQRALATGQVASARMDAPPAFLAALRKRLPASAQVANPPPPPAPASNRYPVPEPGFRSSPTGTGSDTQGQVRGDEPKAAPAAKRAQPATPPHPTPAAAGTWYVQVAALSSPDRARALAHSLNGRVVAAGPLHRVQLGPYATAATARQARDAAARRGYGDARVLRNP